LPLGWFYIRVVVMPANVKRIFLIFISILFIFSTNSITSMKVDTSIIENNEPQSSSEQNIEYDVNIEGTRARSNFQISSSNAVSMPEVDSAWNQSDYRKGPGQTIWADTAKFNSSKNMNYSTGDGHLELNKGGSEVETWNFYGDGPETRTRHQMVWASSRGVFYIFGGGATWSDYSTDLYEFNPVSGAWKKIGTTGAPPARVYHVMVWDSVNELLWVYGGRDSGFDQLNDLWVYDPATDLWHSKGFGPGKRSDAAGVFNPKTSEIIIYGGYAGSIADLKWDVYTYNTTTSVWTQKANYTKRYMHSGVWSPERESMLVYGGYDGSNYVTYSSEYFPAIDKWFNRSGIGIRRYPILAWDTLNEKMILFGGIETNSKNETWYFDPGQDKWTQRMSIPPEPRDFGDADWDDINNRLVVYGGGWTTTYDDIWEYYPNVTGFHKSGELVSSVFAPGHTINLRKVSFALQKPVHPEIGNQPVKIQLAVSEKSVHDTNNFLGSLGIAKSYFTIAEGQMVPNELNRGKYLAFRLNLSTANGLYTPKFKWIKVDYYTYPGEYSFESQIFDIGRQIGLPLRSVNWTSTEPEFTGIEIYFRQAQSVNQLNTEPWENVEKGQSEFGYKTGRYFQYKAVFTTSEKGFTAELNSIAFTFNALPSAPVHKQPANGTWVGQSRPQFLWEFKDTDMTDYQTAYEINIAQTESMDLIVYMETNESINTNCTPGDSLDDGTYYWHVRTRDNYGSWGSWSDPEAFFIDTTKPQSPKIFSKSHPLEKVWYADDRIILSWDEPEDESGIAGFSYILSIDPAAEPDNNISMDIEEYWLVKNSSSLDGQIIEDDIADGTWYFHLRAVDKLGYWSDKATRTVRIDTTAPVISDFTPSVINPGSLLTFNFMLNENHSGVDYAGLYWKYASEYSDRYDEMIANETGKLTLDHQLEQNAEPYIEYYLEVMDQSEPQNAARMPPSGYKRINIVDNIPPKIIKVTGSIDHNLYEPLELSVEVTDNVGVSEVLVFFNDQSKGRTMTKGPDNIYTIEIDRGEMPDLSGYAGENIILYKISATDYQNNRVFTPDSGNYNITLYSGDDSSQKSKTESQGVFDNTLTLSIIMLVIVIVTVGFLLVFFIKKQSKAISDDRHKLRMAIADAQEAGKGAELSHAVGMQTASGIPTLPPQPEGYGTGYQGDLPQPEETPVLPPPLSDLEPAPGESTVAQPATAMAGTTSAEAVSNDTLETGIPDFPGKKGEGEKGPAVELEKGLFVSLPEDNKKVSKKRP